MSQNLSGLKPLGRAVLVEIYEPELKSSVIELPDMVQERMMMLEQRAVVVEVGAAAWPDEPPRAAPGDRVMIARMSGVMTTGTADGKKYRMVNDRDIFCQIVKESEND
jgi:co-chaperonin GroES (HSP10)